MKNLLISVLVFFVFSAADNAMAQYGGIRFGGQHGSIGIAITPNGPYVSGGAHGSNGGIRFSTSPYGTRVSGYGGGPNGSIGFSTGGHGYHGSHGYYGHQGYSYPHTGYRGYGAPWGYPGNYYDAVGPDGRHYYAGPKLYCRGSQGY